MTEAVPLPPSQPSGRRGCAMVIVLLIVLAALLLVCAGVCGGLFYFVGWDGESPFLESVRNSVPILETPGGQNGWFEDRVLSPVYVTALDAVAASQVVTTRLGSPIEAVNSGIEGAALYRRLGSGGLNPAGETIEFAIKGPQGTGTVSVLSTGPEQGGAPGAYYGELRVSKITVTLEDGSDIDVPAPQEQPAIAPIR